MDVWSLGEPASASSVWLQNNEVYLGKPDARVAFRANANNEEPYANAQTILVYVDGEQPAADQIQLLVDGARLAIEPGTETALVPHYMATKDAIAPVAVSLVVNENTRTPYKVTASIQTTNLGDGAELTLAEATLQPARPTDAVAQTAVLPFPLEHRTVEVEAQWNLQPAVSRVVRDAARALRALLLTRTGAGGASKQTRSIGTLAEAVKRIRSAFEKLVQYNSVDGTEGRGRFETEGTNSEFKKLPALERVIMEWMASGTPTSDIFFVANPRMVRTAVVIEVWKREGEAPLRLKLGPPNPGEAWKYFEWMRNGIEADIQAITDAKNTLANAETPRTMDNDQFNELLGRINYYAEIEAGVDVVPPTRSRGTKLLRLWGPELKSVALTPPPLSVRNEGDVIDAAKRTVVAQVRDVRRAFDKEPTMYVVTWHPDDGIAAALAAKEIKVIASDNATQPIVSIRSRMDLVNDPMHMAALLPVGVSCSLGAFDTSSRPLPSIEAVARQALGGSADPDIFKRLGLEHTPEAAEALTTFAEFIVHACVNSTEKFDGINEPVESCILMAKRYAQYAANFVIKLCTKTDSRFVKLNDPRMHTMAGGMAGVIALRRMSSWIGLNAARRPDEVVWTQTCRQSAANMAASLAKLGVGNNLPVHPTTFPFAATQALWMWPASVGKRNAFTENTPLEVIRRRDALDAPPPLSDRTDIAMFVAAKQALMRIDVLMSAMQIAPESEAAHGVRRAMALGRPSVTVGPRSTEEYQAAMEQLNDGMDKQRQLRSRNVIGIDMLRATWARRALNTYKTWKRDDPTVALARETDGVAAAIAGIAKLSVNRDAESTVEYYVPFGLPPGRSPLTGNQLMAEQQVWLELATDPFEYGAVDAAEVTISLKLCYPTDGGIPIPDKSEVSLSNVNPLIITRRGSIIEVPVCLSNFDEEFDALNVPDLPAASDNQKRLAEVVKDIQRMAVDGDRTQPRKRPAAYKPDRYRCVVFTAERLWQALLLSQAVEARTVAIDIPILNGEKRPERLRRLTAAAVIAAGMFVRPSGAQAVSMRLGANDGAVIAEAARLKAGIARARATGLSVLPLSEMAAALAVWADEPAPGLAVAAGA